MYCDYFGFKQEPFTIAPDPSFLYPSSQHRQALAHLKYGVDREGGFILFTGEVGTGKTTLTRLLLEQIPASVRVAYVLNAKLGISDVLASICDELHIALDFSSTANTNPSPKFFIDAINSDLLEAHSKGFKTLVVIEEAQNLDEEVLEMLRLLTNLETNTCKLLHILLVGQPELLELISRPQLRQLNQRVISRFHIEPLNKTETESYLLHRLRKAGCSRKVFNAAAIQALYKQSEGIPRKLNLLAERSLLGSYSQGKAFVGKAQVVTAQAEVFGTSLRGKDKRMGKRMAWGWLSFALVLLAVALFLLDTQPWTGIDSGDLNEVALKSEAETPQSLEANPEPQEAIAELEPELEIELEAEPEAESLTALEPIEITPQALNPYAQLLANWTIDETASSPEQLCLIAASQDLLCEEIGNPALSELMDIDRHQVLTISEGNNSEIDGAGVYILDAIIQDEFQLERAGERYYLSRDEFAELNIESALYLWKPPLGYSDLLHVGDTNRAVLVWLQPLLADINPEIENLITAGRYNQLHADALVEFQRRNGLLADGILGRETLMKLNELDYANTIPKLVGLESLNKAID